MAKTPTTEQLFAALEKRIKDAAPALRPSADGAGNKTPLTEGILDRVVQGVKYVLNGKPVQGWFSPGDPVAPQAQAEPEDGGARGRQFDFAVGYNTRRQPRDGEGITFDQMRALADGYDLLRLVIETRKDQMSKMRWSIALKESVQKEQKAKERQEKMRESQVKATEHNDAMDAGVLPPGLDGKKPIPDIPELPKKDPRILELEEFFAYPDQEHDWETWLRALLEDLFVLDAPCVYPRQTLDGGLYSLELVDGSTVKKLVDLSGRTPLPPEPAYQQVLKGMAAVDYSRDELIYKPRNVRTNKVYGYGPVEQIIMTVNIALRRQLNQLQFYTEGNVPEALIGVPEDWNPDQIRQFQEYWDSIMEGNTAARQHAKFVPGGMTPVFTRPNGLKDEFDDWLARIICFAFSIAVSPLVKDTNKATAETAQAAALSEGQLPVMNWVRGFANYIIWKYFGYRDLEFKWEEEEDVSPETQMKVITGYVSAGIMDKNEGREKLGMDPMTPEQEEAAKPPPMVGDPGDPGAPPKPGQKPPVVGGTVKPVGKTQGLFSALLKGRRKVVPAISRNRQAVQECTAAITKLMEAALTATGEALAKQVRALQTNKAITVTAQVSALLNNLTFEQLQDIAPELAELLEDMTGAGGEAALAQILADIEPAQLQQVNEYAVQYAKERSAELVTQMQESTRDMLRSNVQEAIQEGWSNDKLADLLSENYAFSDARAETIARTETAYADVQGNLEGYRASGLVQGKQWIISQDEICDECLELDGVIVGLDDNFPDGGDGPPLHPNCRCDIIPVLTEEE